MSKITSFLQTTNIDVNSLTIEGAFKVLTLSAQMGQEAGHFTLNEASTIYDAIQSAAEPDPSKRKHDEPNIASILAQAVHKTQAKGHVYDLQDAAVLWKTVLYVHSWFEKRDETKTAEPVAAEKRA